MALTSLFSGVSFSVSGFCLVWSCLDFIFSEASSSSLIKPIGVVNFISVIFIVDVELFVISIYIPKLSARRIILFDIVGFMVNLAIMLLVIEYFYTFHRL